VGFADYRALEDACEVAGIAGAAPGYGERHRQLDRFWPWWPALSSLRRLPVAVPFSNEYLFACSFRTTR